MRRRRACRATTFDLVSRDPNDDRRGLPGRASGFHRAVGTAARPPGMRDGSNVLPERVLSAARTLALGPEFHDARTQRE